MVYFPHTEGKNESNLAQQYLEIRVIISYYYHHYYFFTAYIEGKNKINIFFIDMQNPNVKQKDVRTISCDTPLHLRNLPTILRTTQQTRDTGPKGGGWWVSPSLFPNSFPRGVAPAGRSRRPPLPRWMCQRRTAHRATAAAQHALR